MKKLKNIVFIFLLVLIGLFLHDIWITLGGETISTELFFPKLFENSCFHAAFGRDIRDEKIISFTCSSDVWGGSQWHYEIIMFYNERCVSSTDIFKYPDIKQKSAEEIEKTLQAKTPQQRRSQQYYDFSFFKETLEKEYYDKYQKPLTQAVISTFSFRYDWAWYDHHSQIFWYVNEG